MFQYSVSPQVREVNHPSYFVLNEFSERSLQAFSKALLKASENSQPIFPINIQSDGGSAAILFGFMSLMKEYRDQGMQFASVVAGTAASAGCCIFLYSDFRYMGEFASLLFHSVQLGLDGPLPHVVSQIGWHAEENKRMNEILSKNLKKSKTWLDNQLKKCVGDDWMISANDALTLGMATNIKIPQFNLQISSQFSIS
jgi:ATP-dependent protease ClpP protease subunit